MSAPTRLALARRLPTAAAAALLGTVLLGTPAPAATASLQEGAVATAVSSRVPALESSEGGPATDGRTMCRWLPILCS